MDAYFELLPLVSMTPQGAAREAWKLWVDAAGACLPRQHAQRRRLLQSSTRAMDLADGEAVWVGPELERCTTQKGFLVIPLGGVHQVGGGPGRRGRPEAIGLRRYSDGTWGPADGVSAPPISAAGAMKSWPAA